MTAIRYEAHMHVEELRDIKEKPIDGILVEPENDNLFVWNCAVKGASDTPYKGGTFRFKLELPSNFPFKAPTVVFQTKIYHPGINEEGHICVPILRDEVILVVIQEKTDPFEPDIAALLKTDKAKFLATAKEYTKK
ncbi:ubiquitin-conjugating enzyme [Pisolithus microcarpus]|nr:ubiquitin-conjugating enzyme [Pisolithus microcarpus]